MKNHAGKILCALFLCTNIFGAEWFCDSFQYRLTLETEVDKAGWHEIAIPSGMLVDKASELSGFKFRMESFSPNRVILTQVGATGEKKFDKAGYYLLTSDREVVPVGLKLPANKGDGGGAYEKDGMLQHLVKDRFGKQIAVPVKGGQLYLCRFRNSGGGSSPTYLYEPIHDKGSRLRKYNYDISYIPRLLPQSETDFEVLVRPDVNGKMLLFYEGKFMGKVHSLSMTETKVALVANFPAKGKYKLNIYYQLVNNGVCLIKPDKKLPETVVIGNAKVNIAACDSGPSDFSGKLYSSAFTDVYALSSLEKVTPTLKMPQNEVAAVNISTAKNERESFQLVLSPKENFQLLGVEVDLKSGKNKFPVDAVEVNTVKYVPIRYAYKSSPWQFNGLIGDALVKFKREDAKVDNGNLALHFTIFADKNTQEGIYSGNIILKTDRAGKISIPLKLKVRSFALPEYSNFRTNLGMQYFTKGRNPAAVYHGAKTEAEVKKLTDLYYEKMAENRLAPKNFALYTPLSFKWDAPPKGMNVDAPDNFFRLYDWDFTEYNKQLDRFIGELKMNQICIYHTNAIASNVFPQLPGKKLENSFNISSPFVSMHNQGFREMTIVGYGLTPKHSYYKLAKKITRNQYDRLVLDYLRAIAGNLEKKGYLKYATILIDESENDEFLLHFLSLLKKDPLLKKIKIAGCIQGMRYYTQKDAEGKYVFRDFMDIYVPQIDDNYDRLEPYYKSDYGISKNRSAFMPYIAYTSRLTIDAPALSNRIIGFDVFRRGGCGILDWEILLWHLPYRTGKSLNPWSEPLGYCNGGTAYFYPPLTSGYPEKADYTITPSLRLGLLRDGAEDFDYAVMLENLIKTAKSRKIDCQNAEKLIAEISALFDNAVSWNLNSNTLISLRERIGNEIENLNERIKK